MSSKEHAAAVRGFLKEIRKLTSEVEAISEFSPLAFPALNRLGMVKTELEPKYRDALYNAEQIARSTAAISEALDPGEIARLSAASLTATVHAHQSWNELGALIDRKYAFYLAIISLYIATISFVVCVIGVVIPFLPRG
jgi:hypothetical protein